MPPVFSETAFDSFFPDEEGQIEARKRLVWDARHAHANGKSPAQWFTAALRSKEMCHYVSLLNEQDILEHIAEWVWQSMH